MSDKSKDQSPPKGLILREDRLKAALKANMAKRKAQQRSRGAEADKKKKE